MIRDDREYEQAKRDLADTEQYARAEQQRLVSEGREPDEIEMLVGSTSILAEQFRGELDRYESRKSSAGLAEQSVRPSPELP